MYCLSLIHICVAWEYDHMLAQEMRDGGYQTAVVGKMHVHPPRLG